MSKSKRRKTCAYCGVEGPWQAEHVVPRCLWNGNHPQHMVTVPACNGCNQRYASDEDYFRTVLVAMAGQGSHPEVDALLTGKVRRGLAQSPRLRAEITRGFGRRPTFTSSGLFAGWGFGFEVNLPRLQRCVEKTVRGLFFRKSGRPLAPGYTATVFPGNGFWEDEGFQNVLADMEGWAGLGDDVFQCRCVRDGVDPDVTAWLLVYYKTLAFFAWTGKKAEPDEKSALADHRRTVPSPARPWLAPGPDLTPTGWAYVRSRR
jgi:hypothetical protein